MLLQALVKKYGKDETFYVTTFKFPKSVSLDLELVKKIITDKLILK